VEAVPSAKTEKRLFDRAVTFSPPGVLARDSFLTTNALLENLEVFPQWRTELSPALAAANAEDYKATLRLNERTSCGSSALDGAVSLVRGLPYETIYPS